LGNYWDAQSDALPSSAAELPLHGIGHDADFGHGSAELVGGAVEFVGPVADFVGFVNVDAGAVCRTTVLEVIGHEDRKVGEISATEKRQMG
jgi:hypothetical protein